MRRHFCKEDRWLHHQPSGSRNKVTRRHHLSGSGTTRTKNTNANKHRSGRMETGAPIPPCRDCEMLQPLWRSGGAPRNVHHRVIMWPSNSTKWKWKETSTRIHVNCSQYPTSGNDLIVCEWWTNKAHPAPSKHGHLTRHQNGRKRWHPLQHGWALPTHSDWKTPPKPTSTTPSCAASNSATAAAQKTDPWAQLCGEGSVRTGSHD